MHASPEDIPGGNKSKQTPTHGSPDILPKAGVTPIQVDIGGGRRIPVNTSSSNASEAEGVLKVFVGRTSELGLSPGDMAAAIETVNESNTLPQCMRLALTASELSNEAARGQEKRVSDIAANVVLEVARHPEAFVSVLGKIIGKRWEALDEETRSEGKPRANFPEEYPVDITKEVGAIMTLFRRDTAKVTENIDAASNACIRLGVPPELLADAYARIKPEAALSASQGLAEMSDRFLKASIKGGMPEGKMSGITASAVEAIVKSPKGSPRAIATRITEGVEASLAVGLSTEDVNGMLADAGNREPNELYRTVNEWAMVTQALHEKFGRAPINRDTVREACTLALHHKELDERRSEYGKKYPGSKPPEISIGDIEAAIRQGREVLESFLGRNRLKEE